MDSIGLLAAWVGVASFLLLAGVFLAVHLLMQPLQRLWARTSPARARRRIEMLYAGIEISEAPNTAFISDLISLYAAMILYLVAAIGTVAVSIEILDLGPALLASMLPFSIDSKLLTRITGLLLLAAIYIFVFRLSSLAVRIRMKTLPRQVGFAEAASKEIARLRELERPLARQTAGGVR